jgi:hypothetical protein
MLFYALPELFICGLGSGKAKYVELLWEEILAIESEESWQYLLLGQVSRCSDHNNAQAIALRFHGREKRFMVRRPLLAFSWAVVTSYQ